MVKLRQDPNGNYIARKRLPDDVQDEYGRRHKARYEAKFFARACVGPNAAKQKFREWDAEVTARIDAIGVEHQGQGCASVIVATRLSKACPANGTSTRSSDERASSGSGQNPTLACIQAMSAWGEAAAPPISMVMSLMDHKRTFVNVLPISALPQKADIRQ